MAFTNTAWGFTTGRDKDWREKALCRDEDPELMWPMPKTLWVEDAIAVCGDCKVKVQCLTQGVEIGDWESIRGGLTGAERRRYHGERFEPAEYPPHNARSIRCRSCDSMFYVAAEKMLERGQLCPACGALTRSYSKLRDVVDAYRKLSAEGFCAEEISHTLGYATQKGLYRALVRARRAGLLAAEDVAT